MSVGDKTTGVLLMAYGGPDSLDDIPAYLLDIRGGRYTPQELIDDITERYRLIGGRSPLLEITQGVAARLEELIDMPVYVGMRHWCPFIKDTVLRILADGIEHIIAICMAPHFSTMSIGRYRAQLERALVPADGNISVDFIEQWHTHPEYLRGIAENVRATLKRWSPAEQSSVKVVFTAHSLPEKILEDGDPYDQQLRETARLLAEQLELAPERWAFSYQSAANTGIPWLGPQIEDYVIELVRQGDANILIAPIGFISDHVEILYDIDIGVQQIASEHDVRVERTPMLNDDPALINTLESLVMARFTTAV